MALGILPGAEATPAFALGASGASGAKPAVSLTRASGTVTTRRGLDPRTSFCFSPTPTPSSVTVDPVRPRCKALPASTDPTAVNPFVVATPYPGWANPPLAGSKWVGPQPNGEDANEGAPNYYVYDAEFTFRGCSQVNGSALADNQVGVFLNGWLLASQANSSSPANFNGTPLAFTGAYPGGPAVVDFVVYDSSGPATGLDYTFTVTPLPAADCLVRGSGTVMTRNGLDPDTSFCFAPEPAPSSVAVDPVKPQCKALPKSTDPGTVNPFVITRPFPGWANPPLAGSKWVGPQPNGGDTNEGAPNYYVYDAEFTFDGCAQVNGSALADNQVGVFLNGQLLASQANSSSPANFRTPLAFTGAYPGGPAVVDFVVYDSSGPATGLDYTFTVTPLPAADCQGTGTSVKVSG